METVALSNRIAEYFVMAHHQIFNKTVHHSPPDYYAVVGDAPIEEVVKMGKENTPESSHSFLNKSTDLLQTKEESNSNTNNNVPPIISTLNRDTTDSIDTNPKKNSSAKRTLTNSSSSTPNSNNPSPPSSYNPSPPSSNNSSSSNVTSSLSPSKGLSIPPPTFIPPPLFKPPSKNVNNNDSNNNNNAPTTEPIIVSNLPGIDLIKKDQLERKKRKDKSVQPNENQIESTLPNEKKEDLDFGTLRDISFFNTIRGSDLENSDPFNTVEDSESFSPPNSVTKPSLPTKNNFPLHKTPNKFGSKNNPKNNSPLQKNLVPSKKFSSPKINKDSPPLKNKPPQPPEPNKTKENDNHINPIPSNSNRTQCGCSHDVHTLQNQIETLQEQLNSISQSLNDEREARIKLEKLVESLLNKN